jgi:hypothetical protein
MKRLTLSIALVVSMLAAAAGAALPVEASSPYSILNVRTDGQTVVWGQGGSVYADTVDGENRRIIGQGGAPDVSGSRVVWIGVDGSLAGIDLSTGEPLDLPDLGTPGWFVLSGDRLLWSARENPDAPSSIFVYDFSLAGEPTVLPIGEPADELRVSGDRVVWKMVDPNERWELWAMEFGGNPKMLAAASHDRSSHLGRYDIGGDWIVYHADGGIHLQRWGDPSTERVISRHGVLPTTDSRYVFWNDLGPGAPEGFNILGFDTATDSFIGWRLNLEGHNMRPWARGGAIVWSHALSYNHAHTAEARYVRDILPSAPLPDPSTTSRAWLYFKETGHYLSYGFKDFWLKSGGLPVFGYPLTTEFDELNPDTGFLYAVQYTERQRFEYHPELAGTPYETLLGRLGYADAKRRGLTSHPAFQPLPPTTQSDAHSDFFPQTGHRVSHGFRAYWRSHGLDLGDPGISFRESLALFGYPISEEFVDPDTGLVTQYFERAVFEYHPDNPEPYKVLLRLLGADEMNRRGW